MVESMVMVTIVSMVVIMVVTMIVSVIISIVVRVITITPAPAPIPIVVVVAMIEWSVIERRNNIEIVRIIPIVVITIAIAIWTIQEVYLPNRRSYGSKTIAIVEVVVERIVNCRNEIGVAIVRQEHVPIK